MPAQCRPRVREPDTDVPVKVVDGNAGCWPGDAERHDLSRRCLDEHWPAGRRSDQAGSALAPTPPGAWARSHRPASRVPDRVLGEVGSSGNLVNSAHLAATTVEHRADQLLDCRS